MLDEADTLNVIIRDSRSAFEDRFDRAIAPMEQVAQEFNLPSLARQVLQLRDRLHQDTFNIMVVGSFNAGKSTLINLLISGTHGADPDMARDLLPVDSLPATPVLTVVRYAPELKIVAFHLNGTGEEWSYEDYQREARLCTDSVSTSATGAALGGRLGEISHFEVGVPCQLLRDGVTVTDSPGLSEHPLRTEITHAALAKADACLFLFRSDMIVRQDELHELENALEKTGYCKAVVNLFYGDAASERLERAVVDRLKPARDADVNHKLDLKVAYVDCVRGLAARRSGDVAGLAAAGVISLEEELGAFLTTDAYRAKKIAAVDGARQKLGHIRSEVFLIGTAARAQTEELRVALDRCDEDMQDIEARRDRVEGIFGGMRLVAENEARRSFQSCVRDLELTLEGRFSEMPLASLRSVGGQLTELVTTRAAKEAVANLNQIVSEGLANWGSTSADRPGLLHDLSVATRASRQALEAELAGIDRRIADINLRIQTLDPVIVESEAVVGLHERLLTTGGSLLAFGPLAVFAVPGGWRSVVGTTIAALVASLGIPLLSAVLGIAFAPAVVAGLLLASMTGGSVAGALYQIERRVRDKALAAFKPALRALEHDEKAIAEIVRAVGVAIQKDADAATAALDATLSEQRESLATLRAISAGSLEKKQSLCDRTEQADAQLTAVNVELSRMVDELQQLNIGAVAA